MTIDPRAHLAFPLDVADVHEAREWVTKLSPAVGVFKVGLELFTAAGPEAVHIAREGADCFLDLKLHDIPNTMAKATASAVALGARYLTVHASAGSEALARCAEAAAGSSTELLAVTVLTSTDAAMLASLGVPRSPAEQVRLLAQQAFDAGIRGFVCSPEEAAMLRRALGPEATLVTPGIRPAGSSSDDQKRVMTPRQAIVAGADLLVVGRPIRLAPDPVSAAGGIRDEIRSALEPT